MNAFMLVVSSLVLLPSLSGTYAFAGADGKGTQPARATPIIEGQWTLTIRDNSGAVASVHRFDNHLIGQDTLVELLRGTLKSGGWALGLRLQGVEGFLGFTNCLTPPPVVDV